MQPFKNILFFADRSSEVLPAPQRAVKLAEQLPADLIVMGTVGRVGIPGFFIGDTAEEVLQTTRASVLAVNPADFASPVV